MGKGGRDGLHFEPCAGRGAGGARVKERRGEQGGKKTLMVSRGDSAGQTRKSWVTSSGEGVLRVGDRPSNRGGERKLVQGKTKKPSIHQLRKGWGDGGNNLVAQGGEDIGKGKAKKEKKATTDAELEGGKRGVYQTSLNRIKWNWEIRQIEPRKRSSGTKRGFAVCSSERKKRDY